MPEISIIVPVYNMERYINRCIDSILNQTYSDFELIIVDDGSTDKTTSICDHYSQRDQRIKVIHQKNRGQSAARNAGINVAEGTYLGFVDSDDWIDLDMYECLLSALQKYSADISTCSKYRAKDSFSTKSSAEGNPYPPYNVSPGLCIWNNKEAIERMLTMTYIDHSVCTKLFKREVFHGIRFPEEKYYEDMFVISELLYHAKKIVSIGQAKYYYFYRADSTTMDKFSSKQIDYYYASQSIADFVADKFPDLGRKARVVYYQGLERVLLRMQSPEIKSQYPEEYRQLFNDFKREYRNIMKDEAFNLHRKLALTFVLLRIYSPIKKIIEFKRHKINQGA